MNDVYAIMEAIIPFKWLAPDFMKNAFLAILFAAPLFGALGSVVVSNKMAFFSDAIGHSALTGIAAGTLMGIGKPAIAMVLYSIFLGFAIVSVKFKCKSSADTIIGVFSSASVALGIVILSSAGNFAKYQRYLVGDILSIRPAEILTLAAAALAILALFIVFYNKMLLSNLHAALAKSRGIHVFFYEQLFALATAAVVTLAIRWTGMLVTNSLLVLPAATSRLISKNSRSYLLLSVLVSLLSGITGIAASYYTGSASGATIVLVNAALFLITLAWKSFIAKLP